jgi:hypothetical protein
VRTLSRALLAWTFAMVRFRSRITLCWSFMRFCSWETVGTAEAEAAPPEMDTVTAKLAATRTIRIAVSRMTGAFLRGGFSRTIRLPRA